MFIWKSSSTKKSRCIKTLICFAVMMTAAICAAVFCATDADAMFVEGTYVIASGDAEETERAVPVVNGKLLEIYGALADILFPNEAAGTYYAEDSIGYVDQIQGREYMWHITVDGKVVAAGEKESLCALLEEKLTEHADDSGTYAAFVQDVSVEMGFVPVDTESDIDAVKELLFGENGLLDVKVTKIEYELVDIPFDVTEQESDKHYDYQTGAVIIPGVLGELKRFTETVSVNGEMVSEKTEETILSQPSGGVVAIGTKQYSEASFGEYIWPTTGVITSHYGPREYRIGSSDHKGLDIAGFRGQSIRASDSGEVIFAGWQSGYGKLVKLQHDNGDITYYGHCTSLEVKKGQRVCQGEVIAKMGSTGVSSGPHLHFEIRVGGKEHVDPESRLPKEMY